MIARQAAVSRWAAHSRRPSVRRYRHLPLLLLMGVAAGCAGQAKRFDIWDATTIADSRTSESGRPFVKFFLPMGSTIEEGVGAFAPVLMRAAELGHEVALLGADSGLNREVLIRSLAAHDDIRPLVEMHLIYLGPERDRAAVTEAAAVAGVPLDYVEYP